VHAGRGANLLEGGERFECALEVAVPVRGVCSSAAPQFRVRV